MSKLATGASTTLPSNCSGITGGARISMQSRPGSSQLVHIPEEAHENYGGTSPRTAGGGGGSDGASTVNSAVQANWQRAAEKTASCRTTDGGPSSQPRIMQVIAMSKQQGLLQTHSKSLDESSISCSAAAGCQGAARYRGLNDPDPPSTTGPARWAAPQAHPENNRPVIQAPSTDGSGSWRWRSLDHSTGGGGGGGRGSLRQSFELNDLNRDSESSDSVRDGSIDRKRSNHIVTTTATVSTPPIVTVHTQSTGQSEQRLHPQASPPSGSPQVMGAALGLEGEEGEGRESTLQRKGNNLILIPERTNSPDNARNIFYKGTSMTPVFKD
ncbi:hypothetical protein INR49_006981 [Caranx melampygus]|nr:hypothetical protein INR49_006981 [Caranx melampygus]